MKIGKSVKVVTSPKRNIRKAGERPDPRAIPVEIPKKKKVEVEA